VEELFVIDNSVVMSWCFKDEANAYADAVLEKLTAARAVVPAIWPLEVVNVLLAAERKERLKQADSMRFLALLLHLPIEAEKEWSTEAMPDLLALGRNLGLSSYDLSYLDLAVRRGCPLATLDQKLTGAAKKTGVSILEA